MNFVVGLIIGAALAGFFSYAGGIDEGYSRAYRNCVEHRAKTTMLQEARDSCWASIDHPRRVKPR